MTDNLNAGTPTEENGVKQTILSGGESIARAVIDAGTRVAASYPGRPITKIVEKLIELAPSGCPKPVGFR